MSTITSRCGSVTLMGLGLTLIGLAAAGLLVGAGQVWLQHGTLQDALDNAVIAMQASHRTSAATLQTLVEENSGLSPVKVLNYGVQSGVIHATVGTPVHLWVWAPWMGSEPARVIASTA